MKRTNWSWLAPVAVVLLGAVVSAWELGNADSMPFMAVRRQLGSAPAGASAQTVRPDFSGEWVLDLAKSVVPPSLQQAEMTVQHQDPTLAVTDRQRHDTGGTVGTYHYTIDGVASTATQGGTTYETTGRWEGPVLVIRQKITGKMNSEPVERWSLSADGNVLTIERSRNDTKGTATRTFVYLKQHVGHRPVRARPQSPSYFTAAGSV